MLSSGLTMATLDGVYALLPPRKGKRQFQAMCSGVEVPHLPGVSLSLLLRQEVGHEMQPGQEQDVPSWRVDCW